ncbi:MAG TPA: response regulator transcription factor [Candidatus Eremiobacteraceae bacterium]|nr:response regulator transcription factor [Candidatus Eremiobacteraceae bacterium]
MARILKLALVVQQGVFRSSLGAALDQYRDLETTGWPQIPERGFSAEPDVAVLDLDFQAYNHRELMRQLVVAAPNAKSCIIAYRGIPATVRQCLSLGASGFLLKDCSVDELYRAVKTIASGEMVVDPRMASTLLKGIETDHTAARTPALSQREMEVIRLIALGLTNRQIAARLTLSEKTIKNHVSHIFRKLKITARTEAAIHAISHNLMRANEPADQSPSS